MSSETTMVSEHYRLQFQSDRRDGQMDTNYPGETTGEMPVGIEIREMGTKRIGPPVITHL